MSSLNSLLCSSTSTSLLTCSGSSLTRAWVERSICTFSRSTCFLSTGRPRGSRSAALTFAMGRLRVGNTLTADVTAELRSEGMHSKSILNIVIAGRPAGSLRQVGPAVEAGQVDLHALAVEVGLDLQPGQVARGAVRAGAGDGLGHGLLDPLARVAG